ncbi:MAG: helix-turn-helix domain-containing protein [Thiobacillus sp.]|nr:helix-turn-helix domain-containing protein [Thiobacillus sp.]
MSASVEATVGQILRETRETQKITQEDVAFRLRLMHRQIEAIESDDFQSLGQPVFARGFVRNYARLLGIDPDELLERMEGAPAEPAPIAQSEPPLTRSWLTSPWVILLMLGVVVVVAVPVSLYLWLNSDADEPVPAASSAPASALSPPVPAAVATEPVVAPVPLEQPADGALAVADVDAHDTPADDAAPSTAASVGGVVHLELGDESWVEVRDASGQLLHRQLNPAGSSVDIRGQPPFAMVIGNASQARMTYNGRPIDLKPFIDVTVARFTLEE